MLSLARDVALVSMPVTFLSPSLAMGLLKTELAEEGISSKTIYSSLRFISFLGVERYREIALLMRRINMGWEILFAPLAGFTSSISAESLFCAAEAELAATLDLQGKNGKKDNGIKLLREHWQSLTEAAEAFIDQEADYILSMNPRIVGCAILTQQRNASFALLKKIKEKSPNIVTMVGGGCCAAEAGLEFLRKVPTLDYVFSGEADGVFAEVCKTIMSGDIEKLRRDFPEVLMRGSRPFVRMLENMEECRYPDYDDFFAQIQETYASSDKNEADDVRYLILEGSRGCWYGEYKRCNFCGLHSAKNLLHHREKTSERFFAEATALAKKYDCRDIIMSDSALGKKFIASLKDTPDLGQGNLRIMAECRSTIKREDLRRLKSNGFYGFQPGIESLSDEILKLMNKGVTVADQLAFLKNARILGLRAVWNILHTLPGDCLQWYEEMLNLMKHIHHFEPPYNILKLLLAKGSVYVEQAEEFGLFVVSPAVSDIAMNPDDEEFTRKTAIYYQSPNLTPNLDMISRLHSEVDNWRRDFTGGAHLIRVETSSFAAVRDARDLSNIKTYRFTGAKQDILSYADELISEFDLRRKLEDKYKTNEIDAALFELERDFIIYRKNSRVLSLATPKNCEPYKNGKKMVTL